MAGPLLFSGRVPMGTTPAADVGAGLLRPPALGDSALPGDEAVVRVTAVLVESNGMKPPAFGLLLAGLDVLPSRERVWFASRGPMDSTAGAPPPPPGPRLKASYGDDPRSPGGFEVGPRKSGRKGDRE
jgi:hypothetical protein